MGPIPTQIIDKFFSFPWDFRLAAEKIIGKTISKREDFEGVLVSDIDFGRLFVLFSPRKPNKFKYKTEKTEKVLEKEKKKKKKRK
jgi:hypothetical protein